MYYAAFDIGNVLVHIDFSPFEKCWRKWILNIGRRSEPPEHYMDFLNDLHGQQDVGLTTVSRHLKERFGFSRYLQSEFEEAWNQIIIPNKQMMDFLKELEHQDVKIALLSNMGLEHATFIRESLPELFQGRLLHLSCEVGARKPTKLYYQSFLQDHDEFTCCTYVDDLDRNLQVGETYGFNCFKFELDKEEGEVSKDILDSLRKNIFGIDI